MQLDAAAQTTANDAPACAHERRLEAKVLVRSVIALRLAGLLTDDEYEAKRARLAPLL